MKKIFAVIVLTVVLFSLPRLAQAAIFWEEFTGNNRQAVYEGQDYNFRFDFWYLAGGRPGIPGANSDDSSLSLVNDVSGVFQDYASAKLSIDLSSNDRASETARINLRLYSAGFQDYNLGTFSFFRNNNNIYTLEHEFTPEQLDYLDDSGWARIAIKAVATPWWNYNDFYINKVRMEVTPIPEPASMSLLGLGLLGLARLRRKR